MFFQVLKWKRLLSSVLVNEPEQLLYYDDTDKIVYGIWITWISHKSDLCTSVFVYYKRARCPVMKPLLVIRKSDCQASEWAN